MIDTSYHLRRRKSVRHCEARLPCWFPHVSRSMTANKNTIMVVGFVLRHSSSLTTTISKITKRSSNFLLSLPLILVGSLVCAVKNFRATIPIIQPPSNNSVHAAAAALTKDTQLNEKRGRTFDPDSDCPFRHSGLYRRVFVYPNYGDVENGRKGSILSAAGARNHSPSWPWLAYDDIGRHNNSFQYNLDGTLVQYSTELLVREIF